MRLDYEMHALVENHRRYISDVVIKFRVLDVFQKLLGWVLFHDVCFLRFWLLQIYKILISHHFLRFHLERVSSWANQRILLIFRDLSESSYLTISKQFFQIFFPTFIRIPFVDSGPFRGESSHDASFVKSDASWVELSSWQIFDVVIYHGYVLLALKRLFAEHEGVKFGDLIAEAQEVSLGLKVIEGVRVEPSQNIHDVQVWVAVSSEVYAVNYENQNSHHQHQKQVPNVERRFVSHP